MRTEERRRTEEKGSIGIGEAGARQPGIFGPWRWQCGTGSAFGNRKHAPRPQPHGKHLHGHFCHHGLAVFADARRARGGSYCDAAP